MTRDADQVVQVRVRSPHGGAGRRLRSALGAARLHPPSLPPAAVLVVRQFAAPEAGARLSPGWEGATHRALAEMARRAVRLRRGRVPAHAEAVLFVDEAEFIACAALALARRRRPWWAQTLGARASVARVLTERPRAVPAVLGLLLAWSRVEPVLSALRPDESRALLAVVAQAFGVAEAVRPSGLEPSATRPSIRDAAARAPWAEDDALAAAVARVAERGDLASAVLLGVAGLLARAPHRLRTGDAARDLANWVRTAADRAVGPQTAPPAPEPPLRSPPVVEDQPVSPPLSGASPPPPAPTLRRPQSAAPPASSRQATDAPPQDTSQPPTRPAPDAPPDGLPDVPPWPAGTATGLGGALFVLPLMRALALPDAFEVGWHLASTTGTWGVLEALARALLGEAHDRHAADPLWRALAVLDGRSPDAPPRPPVVPEDPTALPPGWPPPETAPPAPGLARLPPTLGEWTRLALPTVQAHLVDSLGLGRGETIADALLLRDATLHVTPSHVDLVMPLASAGLAVRRAGLDIDPGWVPAVGRVVQFHYVP